MVLGVTEFIKENNLENSEVERRLLELQNHVVFSNGYFENRYNILDPRHTVYKHEDGVEKEWSFGHVIVLDGQLYFSERATENGIVKPHEVSKNMYFYLRTEEIYDMDRHARVVTEDNIGLIIMNILALKDEGLIP